jgi:hypothetical protein
MARLIGVWSFQSLLHPLLLHRPLLFSSSLDTATATAAGGVRLKDLLRRLAEHREFPLTLASFVLHFNHLTLITINDDESHKKSQQHFLSGISHESRIQLLTFSPELACLNYNASSNNAQTPWFEHHPQRRVRCQQQCKLKATTQRK